MNTFFRISPHHALAMLLSLGLSCTGLADEQSDGIKKLCPVEERKVDVTVTPVPNIPQRCYEVAYHEQRAYICVAAGGTPEGPYSYVVGRFDRERVTKDGWTGGGNFGNTAERAFRAACSWTVREHETEEARLKFEPSDAGEKLDDYFGRGAEE